MNKNPIVCASCFKNNYSFFKHGTEEDLMIVCNNCGKVRIVQATFVELN